VSGGSMQNNNATGGNGGALYAGSGAATMSTVTLSGNSAATGKGGAVYLDSGSLTLTTVTATGNSAVNGAAIFTNTGRASFSGGSYTGNIASNGGAVGVGNKDARLYFTGDVQVKDNKLGTGDDAPKSNVYLDQDDDAVINIDTLGGNAAIGIYVADSVENTRGVPGARFAVYTSNSNVNKITNDRYTSLTVQSDTAAKKLYWGNSIKVTVCYMSSFRSSLPPVSNPASIKYYENSAYYPDLNDAAISELATELYTKYGSNYKNVLDTIIYKIKSKGQIHYLLFQINDDNTVLSYAILDELPAVYKKYY
jgi:predicted outer membrane repeat protein